MTGNQIIMHHVSYINVQLLKLRFWRAPGNQRNCKTQPTPRKFSTQGTFALGYIRACAVTTAGVHTRRGRLVTNLNAENPKEKGAYNKGTWCSWLSRSLSISLENLREGSGSIPDVSIFIYFHSKAGSKLSRHPRWSCGHKSCSG